MRPGRLDRILYVGPPDLESRKEIFRVRFETMAVAPDIDIDELAQTVRDLLMVSVLTHVLTFLRRRLKDVQVQRLRSSVKTLPFWPCTRISMRCTSLKRIS